MVSSQAASAPEVKGSHWFEVDGLFLPRAVGGHPALDFVNTWAGWGDTRPDGADGAGDGAAKGAAKGAGKGAANGGGDFLRTYDHLAVWASVSGLLEADAASALRRRAAGRRAEAEAILEDARRFRVDLHALALAPSDPRALRGVNQVVRRAAANAELVGGPGAAAPAPRWVVGGGLERPLLAVAWAAADLFTREDLSSIGSCPGDGCGWVFLDPRGRRRWCSMQWCGNRAKVRAHAERHRG